MLSLVKYVCNLLQYSRIRLSKNLFATQQTSLNRLYMIVHESAACVSLCACSVDKQEVSGQFARYVAFAYVEPSPLVFLSLTDYFEISSLHFTHCLSLAVTLEPICPDILYS